MLVVKRCILGQLGSISCQPLPPGGSMGLKNVMQLSIWGIVNNTTIP